MTTPTIARCPRCQARSTVFIRSDDGTDLVCLSQICRGSVTPQPPPHALLAAVVRTLEVAVMTTDTPCQSQGCDSYAVYTVAKDSREKLVCRKCAAEMIYLFGWSLR